jgi:hypothetical protein
MADWQQLDLGFEAVLSPLSTGISGSVGGLAGILQTGIAVLDVLSSFLVVNSSPLLGAVETLRAEILNLLQDLGETGVYGLFLVPETLEEYVQYRGGYGKFQQLFLESLNDVDDLERPQFPSTAALGGVILYLSSEDPLDLLLNGAELFEFFSRPFPLGLPAPVNLTASPVFNDGQGNVSRIKIIDTFTGNTSQPNALLFEWQEPRVARDVFFDFFRSTKFILERSKSREGTLILKPSEDESPTRVTPLDKRVSREGRAKSASEPLLDAKGRPVYYWEPVDPSDPFIEAADLLDDTSDVTNFNFIAGSYAFVLDVPPGIDNGYYYRVRAVPQDATLDTVQGRVFTPEGEEDRSYFVLKRNGEILSSDTAPASAPVKGFIPEVDTTFDLPSALLNVYRAAYKLRFDTDVFNTSGDLAIGSSSITPTLPESLFRSLRQTLVYEQGDNPDVLYFPEPLFETSDITTYTTSAGSLENNLVADAAEFDPFGGIDEFIQPRLSLTDSERVLLAIDRVAIPQVQSITPIVANNEGLFEVFRQLYTANQVSIEGVLESEVPLFLFNGDDAQVRGEVFSLLQLVNGFSRTGAPPNWQSVKVLDDLFPDASEAVDRLFNLITSFEALLQDATTELQGTIQGIQDRLTTLTALLDRIDTLITSLNAILTLDFDINLLYIPPAAGGNARVITEVLTATNPPDSDPNDYFLAIALLGGTADIFSLIFGV